MATSDWLASFEAAAAAIGAWDPSATPTLEALEAVRVEYLGRSGRLTEALKGLKDLPLEDRKLLGPRAQSARAGLEERIARRRAELESRQDLSMEKSGVDVTLPALPALRGRLHPVTLMMGDMTRVLGLMGYSLAEGPLVETDWHNFEALNIPAHHPARDAHDTVYLKDLWRQGTAVPEGAGSPPLAGGGPLLMRTHTSPVQVRTMEKTKPPLKIVCPGRAFRRDAVDASHSAVFHQMECLAIDRGVTFADLKGTLDVFMRALLGQSTRLRFRPSFFPFTEPSAQVDVNCLLCGGKGCPVCKGSGWLEMLGAGVVNPNVFKLAGLDPEEWTGFAFGIGIERLAMMKYRIPDIRLFYENDLRFLDQFDEDIL
ncbi:MAG: phenylalanine--tRNA ligase subunit alpha [Elusimicrobia bacterium]|nr:phenylalanine--tRNA ligase subunit alpha [Elusimicrobiota bacterium]